jgi:hypothetical protein
VQLTFKDKRPIFSATEDGCQRLIRSIDMNKFPHHILLAGAIGAGLLTGAAPSFGDAACTDAKAPCHPEKEAYYGDLHLHTTLSYDAYISRGTKVTPDQAYRFASGQPIEYLGQRFQRAWPLDFMAVTDHAENMGLFNEMEKPDSAFANSKPGQYIKQEGPKGFWQFAQLVIEGKPIPEFDTRPALQAAWHQAIDAANRNYQPGRFTTFIGYEWTSHGEQRNLHRNVIFRGDRAPYPFSAVDSQAPEELWSYLENSREQGFEVISIPHNANASDGLMYNDKTFTGQAIDRSHAERRIGNEPLAEISQGKGQSETHPLLSPADEFANFEIFEYLLASTPIKSKADGSYLRQAYGRGLLLWEKLGVNPYKSGVVGGSDFHNGLSISAEQGYTGGMDGADMEKILPDRQLATRLLSRDAQGNISGGSKNGFDNLDTGSASLTGVWAEQNTRDAIFGALLRKETFATSGTRLKLRFFGGWQYDRQLLDGKDWLKTAYAQGVPMGGDLPPKPAPAAAPRFVVQVDKAPEGANLDRVQIIKVSTQNGQYREKIYDVALSDQRRPDPKTGKIPAVGNTVDLKTATYQNRIGAAQLAVVWEDPDFVADQPAVYYLRALEIPTPRWSLLLAVKMGLPLTDDSPATIQERGWSSPIWYQPPRRH